MRKLHLITTSIKAAFILAVLVITITGCRKKVSSPGDDEKKPLQVEEVSAAGDPSKPVVTIPADNTLQPTKNDYNFVFDWEHAQNMPNYPGTPVVPVPWSDQAVRNYDEGLRYDYKKSDGWELVYNDFSETMNFDSRIFMLYNKFRGLLRYYCYSSQPSNPGVDSYRSFINEITWYASAGITTPMMNFAGQHIVDMDADARNASLLEQWPISLHGWYISQFEVAYDSSISKYDFTQLQMNWTVNFAKTLQLSFNDVPVLDKWVYLQQPGLRFNNSHDGTLKTGSMQLQIKSVPGLNDLPAVFPTAVTNELKQNIVNNVNGNMLNAMLVPALGITNYKLDVKAAVRLDYNLVGFVPGLSFAIPGMNNSKITGAGPAFNEPMGIFYLASKPVVKHEKIDGALSEQYTLVTPSVEYVINPFVQSHAEVRNFSQEIVAVDEQETKNLTEAKMYKGRVLKASQPLNLLGVRVSFEVVPKNGSTPVKIIKTFKANVQGN